MKKILPFLLFTLFFASCQKDPDLSKLENDFIVSTNYDKNTNFSSYTTYYIPDSILIIGDDKQPRYWTGNQTDEIIGVIKKNMDARGYTQTTDKTEADLGLQVSYIESTSYFQGYNDYPYWWWGYPGYWGPGYWGDWGGWYYPYPVIYSYNVGSLLSEIVDLKTKLPKDTNSKLTVLWTAYLVGLLSGSDQINIQLSKTALEQAFTQSPYIKK